MKKIVIGLVSIIVIAFIVLYFTSRPKLESDGSYSPSTLALALATVDVSDFENITYQKLETHYKVLTEKYGYTITTDELSQISNKEELMTLIEKAITRQ